MGLGFAGDEPVEALIVAESDALEHGGGLVDHGRAEVGASAHPAGVDEGELGEGVPCFAEVDLVGVADGGGRVDHDLVADEQEGMGPGLFGVDGAILGDAHAFACVELDELGGDTVKLAEEDIGEHDGGVGVGVGVDAGDLVDGDGGEEADGEGGAVAADHSGGDEGEVVLGPGGVDDGGEPDIGVVVGEHGGDLGGDGLDELAAVPSPEAFDEGDGVEELDRGDAGWSGLGGIRHGDGSPGGAVRVSSKNHEIRRGNRYIGWHWT